PPASGSFRPRRSSWLHGDAMHAMTSNDTARRTWALALTSAASFMVALDALVVTTALPSIRVGGQHRRAGRRTRGAGRRRGVGDAVGDGTAQRGDPRRTHFMARSR